MTRRRILNSLGSLSFFCLEVSMFFFLVCCKIRRTPSASVNSPSIKLLEV